MTQGGEEREESALRRKPCSGAERHDVSGPDGTRTRDLLRDRQAF